MKKDFSNTRLYLLFVFFVFLAATITGRLFLLQIKDHQKYKKLAEAQHMKEKTLYAKRGKILFNDGINILAENQGVVNIAVSPREVKDVKEVVKVLSELAGIKKSVLNKKISDKNKPWIPIKNNVPLKKSEKLNLPGIYLESSLNRVYPQSRIASQVVGFYGYDVTGKKRVGQYGVEGYYQKTLSGEDGFRRGAVDANQQPIFSSQNKIQEPKNGDTLVLTIDPNIQFFIEDKLKETYKKYRPDSATFMIVSPKTGDILAMATLPSFDPNNYQKEKNIEVFKNPAVSAPFEPGSIFKPLTMAAALEGKAITPQTTYVDTGKVTIDNFNIKNSDLKSHGKKTMTQVLEYSLNTGTVFAQQKLGREKFVKYVKKFGFGKKTGIDLFGEETGDINNIVNPRSNEKMIECANASFGQGISTTPVQIVAAFSAIANQGKMIQPRIVKKIIYADGKEKNIKVKSLGKVISPETASKVSAMMVSAIRNGYSGKAGVKGYLIAGKTGTAQAPWTYFGINKKGYSNRVVQSFINFAPAFNPEFILLLKMDGPRSGPRFSSDSLAPIAKEINQYLFGYLGIPPDK
jgi:cell division protein FtsI/penicillin-binding protein 2